MIGWTNAYLFDGQCFAEMIVEDAKSKKSKDYIDMSYEAMVREIAEWLRSWMRPELPKPSRLMALLTDAFLLVMKTKRMKLTIENYMEFAELLEADVLRVMAKHYVKKDKGFRTSFQIKG